MCGLTAVFAYGPQAAPVEPTELDAMRDAMRARGPDGAGSWIDSSGRVGLGHRRLAILDVSDAGAQPMAAPDGGQVIVFNGEIYNFRDLRRDLEDQGVRFRSQSDTEVLLALYRRHGPEMVARLRGMFAFALWDEERQGLLLARDPLGIKPLYLADDGVTLRVASQVKALRAGGRVDTAPSAAGWASFFLWGHVADPFTVYRAITQLPAGGVMWLDRGGGRRAWQFNTLTQMMEAPPPAEQPDLRAVLLDSVRRHMISDVPVGVFLSAGRDSALVAALAAEAAAEPLHAVTLGFAEFAGTAHDEVPLARQVAGHLGARHHVEQVTAADFAACRERILADMDQPGIDGVNTWFVARAAARCGLKVVLSGLGGDELFGGYDTFSQVPRLVRALRPLRLLPGLGAGFRMVAAGWLHRFASPKAAGLLELGSDIASAYLLRRGLFMPWELPAVMGADMARQGWRELNLYARLGALLPAVRSDRQRIMALEAGWYMRHQLLRDSDWAGMAHSLEIRVPLVDVEVYRALMPAMVSSHPPDKAGMAACARPPLPRAVLDRPKTGFFIPVADWMCADAGPGGHGLRGWARAIHRTWTQGTP